MHDTGTSSIVYVRYWYYQYCNITILVFLVLYSVVNITILVIPVSQPAASYYPKIVFQYCKYMISINILNKVGYINKSKSSSRYLVGKFNLNNCNYNIHLNMNIKKKLLFNIDNNFKI